MTVQETIIDAFKASQAAHSRALATIGSMRSDNAALEAEIKRLNALVASLKSQIAHLESESLKIVEPAAIQTFLASLSQLVEETQQVTAGARPAQGSASPQPMREPETLRPERSRQDEGPPSPPSARPVLRQVLDREYIVSDTAEAAR